MNESRETILAQLDELQNWFARRSYGWRERANPDQLRQWDAREKEESRLNDLLADLDG